MNPAAIMKSEGRIAAERRDKRQRFCKKKLPEADRRRSKTEMDLFDLNNNEYGAKPLADKMRANNLDEFIGQSHIVAEGSLLRRAIKLDRLGSCIFWGPPGCGKTTLANIIAATTHGNFIKLNAVQSGVADVKKAVEDARNSLKMYNKKTYLLLDECHRFNKTQSDSLLPAIESDTYFVHSKYHLYIA